MRKKWMVMGLLITVAFPVAAQKKEQQRIENAGKVVKEILNAPDSIPQSVLDKADCDWHRGQLWTRCNDLPWR
jgi:hypothetical protein